MSLLRTGVIALILATLIPAARAQWPASTFSAVQLSDSSDAHTYPLVFSDGAGGAVVTYFADSADYGMNSIMAQRVDSAGTVQWGANGVQAENSTDNIIYNEWTRSADIVSDGKGGVIAVYKRGTAPDEDIYAQRVDASGAVRWGADSALCNAAFTQQTPVALADGQGGAFIAWEDDRMQSGNYEIYLQRIDSLGNRMWADSGVVACTLQSSKSDPVLCSDGNGGVVVTWSDQRRGAYDVYAQRLDGAGTAVWPDSGIKVYHDTEWMDNIPCVMAYGGQGKLLCAFIIPASTERYLKVQRVDTSGVLEWGSYGVQLSYSMGIDYVSVLPDSAGGAVYVWEDQVDGPEGVYAQRVDAGGSFLWGANVMLSDGSDYCIYPRAVEDSTGMFTVVWADSSDTSGSTIKAQRIDLDGSTYWRSGGEIVAEGGGGRGNPSLAVVAPGRCVAAWQDSRGGWNDIYAQRLPVPEPEHNVYNAVTDRYFTTLAEALDTMACAPGDFIVLMKDTVYTGNFTIPEGVGLMADSTLTDRPTISGGGSGVVVRMGEDTEIHGVRIVNSDTCGLLFDNLNYGGTCEVTGCEVDSCGTEYGVPAVIVNESYNVTFVNNVIRERNSGIDSVFCVSVNGMSMNTRFYNNVFLGEYWGGIEVTVTSSTEDVHIFNNLFSGFGNGAGGAAVRNGYSGTAMLYIRNNIFTGNYMNVDFWNTPMMLYQEANCNWGNDSSVVESLDFVADPLFADTAAGDYHLRAHSPCIDAGAVLDSVANMYFGIDADGSPIDIGPYGGPLADAKGVPARLGSFAVINSGGYDSLAWTVSADTAFAAYYVYRDTSGSGFSADTAALYDSVLAQGTDRVGYADGGKKWYYKIGVANSSGYGSGLRLANGHAPVLSDAYYDDNMSTGAGDDTLTLVFSAALDTGALSSSPWDYFSVYGGSIALASLIKDAGSDSVLHIVMSSFDVRPESIAVLPGQLSGANGVEVLDTHPHAVRYPAPYIRKALYHDKGTGAYDDDVITVIFNTPVAADSVDTNFSGAFSDFVFYGGSQTTTTTKLGTANDETLLVCLGAGDMPPYAIRPQSFGLWDTSGTHPSTDTLPVLIADISPPRPDSVYPEAFSPSTIDPYASIGAVFTRPMASGTIDSSSFIVSGGLYGPYGGSVYYDSYGLSATFSPATDLRYGERVTCMLTPAITDSLGDHMKRSYSWTFRVDEYEYGSDSLGHDPYVRIPAGGDVTAAVWADMDQNGFPDLVVAVNGGPNRIHFNHDGTLEDSASWSSQQSNATYDVAVGDVNGDGRPDLMFANNLQENTLYLNGTDSLATAPAWTDGDAAATYGVALADIDGNGALDLLTAEYGQANRVYFDSSGVFKAAAGWGSGLAENTCGVAAADIDGDGLADIAYANGDGGFDRAYLNEGGAPAATASWEAANGDDTRRIILEDIDLDGRPDLVCAVNGTNRIYYNNGTVFNTAADWTSTPGDSSCGVGVIDDEYDGDLDLVFVNAGGYTVVYRNDGGTVNASPVWQSNTGTYGGALAVGDYDYDGDADLVCVDTVSGLGRNLALFYRGDTPPVLGNFTVSHDTAGRAVAGPGYVYIEFEASDMENDSLALNDSYFSVGDSGSWTWLSYTGNTGFQLTAAGSSYTLAWDSRADQWIESDSVWVRLSLWDPVGSYVSGYYYGGPFLVDNRGPVFGDSLDVVGSTDSSVTLQWGMASDVHFDRYEIWYDSTGTVYRDATDSLWGPARDSALGNASTVTTTVTGLRSGTYYGFRIWAYDSLGNDSSASSTPLFVYTDARVDGYVTDSLSSPVPGAPVVMVDTAYARLDTAYTDSTGYYRFGSVKMFEPFMFYVDAAGFEVQWYDGMPDSASAAQIYVTGDTTLDTAYLMPPPLFQPVQTAIESLRNADADWADYDGDGLLDLLICGDKTGSGPGYTHIFHNDGNESFSPLGAGIQGVYYGTAQWIDYDLDNDPDVFVAGDMSSMSPFTGLYRNDGGSFSLEPAGFDSVYYSTSAWGDYDNDGDPDLFLMGQGVSGLLGHLYRNDGGGVFTLVDSTLDSLSYGAAAWADYDGDGDQDLFVTGEYASMGRATLYRNDAGTLTDAGAGITGTYDASAAWGDYDNDGDPDLLLSGTEGSMTARTVVYNNDGGSFTPLSLGIDSTSMGQAVWGDFNNDGWLDAAVHGYNENNMLYEFADVYFSEAGTSFVRANTGMTGMYPGRISAADVDDNGTLDLLLYGNQASFTTTTYYRNTAMDTNTAPQAPAMHSAMPSSDTTLLAWSVAVDDLTPAAGLSYNVAVGRFASAFDVVSPLADSATGKRYAVAAGNAGYDTTFMLLNLSPGRYYWKVQAVDHSFAGGAFTALDSFEVVIDTVGPQLVGAEYYSNGTADAGDDSLFLVFDEAVVFDSLDFSVVGAGADFAVAGYGNLASATAAPGDNDSTVVLTFQSGDSVLSLKRSRIVLRAGELYDFGGNANKADTLEPVTYNVCNLRTGISYQTLDDAHTSAASGDSILVLDEGLYTDALHIARDISFLNVPGRTPVVQYDGDTYNLYLLYNSGYSAGFTGFGFNGINIAGDDTLTKLMYVDGGTFVNCEIHDIDHDMNAVITTLNGGGGPLVFDSCTIYGSGGDGIAWSKTDAKSAITNCRIYGISGSAITASSADSTVISHNQIDSASMGIYFSTGCDENLVAMNVVNGCNYGLNIGASGAGTNNRILFNTVYGCATTGIRVGTDATAPDTVMYNVAWGNTTDLDTISARQGPYADFNCYGTAGAWVTGPGAVNADPLFTDAAGGDFALQPGSPAIGRSDVDSLRAVALELKDTDFDGLKRPMPAGSYWDLGAGEEQTVMLDLVPPDNDMTLTVTAIDTDKVEVAWTAADIDSGDADSVDVWYRYSAGVDGHADPLSVLHAVLPVAYSVDTITDLATDSMLYVSVIPRDTMGNYADTSASSSGSIFMYRPATWAAADLVPDTAVAGENAQFVLTVMPQDGTMDQVVVVTPFTAPKIDSVGIGGTRLALTGSGVKPLGADSAHIWNMGAETLFVELAENRLGAGDTMSIWFSDSMTAVPVTDSFDILGKQVFLASQYGLAEDVPAAFTVTTVPGPVDHYLMDVDTLGQTAGIAFNLKIAAKDRFGNTVTNIDTSSMTFAFSGPGAAPDATPFTYPADAAVRGSLATAGSDSVGKAVLLVTAYNAETCSLRFTDVYNGLWVQFDSLVVAAGPAGGLFVEPAGTSVTADDSVFFTARAEDAWMNAWDVTADGNTYWYGTGSSRALTAGLYHADTVAVNDVWAEYLGVSDTVAVTVTHGIVAGLDVVPDSATVTADSALVLVVTAVDADGNAWDASDTSTGTVWGTNDSLGGIVDNATYQPALAGTFDVVAQNGAGSDTCRVTVTHGAVTDVVLTPATAAVTADDTVPFTLTAYDAAANSWDVTADTTAVWNGTGSKTAVAVGAYSADSIGVWTVTGTYGGFSDTAGVTVDYGAITTLTIDIDSAVITADSSLQLAATASDDDGNTLNVTDSAGANWNTDDVGSSLANGLFVPADAGTWKVWCAYDGADDTCYVTVTHGAVTDVALTPVTAAVTADDTVQFTLTAYDAAANGWDATADTAVVWSGTGSKVAVTAGAYVADSSGIFSVYASYGSSADTAGVTVDHGVMTDVLVQPATATVTADSSLYLTALGADEDGNLWDISDSASTVWYGHGSTIPADSGRYQADSVGTWEVHVTNGGISDTAQVTVTAGAVTALTLAPAGTTVTADELFAYALTASDADGNTWDVTDSSSVVWAEDGTMTPVTGGAYYADTAGTFTVTAGYAGRTDTAFVTVVHGSLFTMTLAPAIATVDADSMLQLTATAADEDGNQWDITDSAATAWYGPGSASLITAGAYSADTAGTWLVRAGSGGRADTCTVTVIHGDAAGVLVTPGSAALTADTSVQFTARCFDGAGNLWDVTDSASWSNDEPGNTMAAGLYEPDSAGTYAVYASYFGHADTATAEVSHGQLTAVVITSGDFTTTADDTTMLVLAASDADGNMWDATSAAVWSTGDTTGGTADSGRYLPYGTGTYSIVAAYDGQSDTISVTVNPGATQSLAVTPVTAAVTADTVLFLTAETVDRNGNRTDVTIAAAWSTDDMSATVSNGTYAPVTAGTYNIWASYDGRDDTCGVTVTAGAPVTLSLTPAAAVIAADSSLQFSATVRDADGNVCGDVPAWGIDPVTAGTVSTGGLFTPDGTGVVLVVCTAGAAADTATVTVESSALASIVIAGDSLVTISADTVRAFIAAGKDAAGDDMAVQAEWSVSDTSSAHIDNATGVLTPLKTGTVTVTATVDTLTDQAVVTVVPGTLAVFVINQAADTISTDEIKQYGVTATDTKGNAVGGTAGWSVSDGTVGFIDSTGLFVPQSTGAVTVSAVLDGRTASVPLTVEAGQVASVAVSGNPGTVSTDTLLQLTATAYDNAASEVAGTDFVWSLEPVAAGFIDSAGTFDPVRPGTVLVLARAGAVAGTTVVTVVPGRPAYLVVAAAAGSVAADGSLQYAASVYDADSNLTADVPSWSVTGPCGSIGPDGLFDADSDGSAYVVAVAGAAVGSVAVLVYDDIPPDVALLMPLEVRHTSVVACTVTAADTAGHTGSAGDELTLEYAFDGGSWESTGGTFVLQELVDGRHAVAVRATDAFGNVASAVTGSVTVALAPYAVAGGTWRMLSVPMDVDGASMTDLVAAGTSYVEYLYRWDENALEDVFTLKYVDVAGEPLQPGAAYWLRASAGLELAFGAGHTFAAEDTVRLLPGWNQVGNPYAFPVDWFAASVVSGGETVSMDTALARGLLDNALHFYNGNGDSLRYDMVRSGDGAAFAPWTGCWVNAAGTLGVLLPRAAYLDGAPAATAARNARSASGDGWELRLGIRSGDLADHYNYIGVHPSAADGRDRYDAYDPPVLDRYARLSVQDGADRLACDIRPAGSGIREWYLAAESSEGGSGSVLAWDAAQVPAGTGLYLYDLSDGGVTDMRTQGSYAFTAPSGVERLFKVVAASGVAYEPDPLPSALAVTSVAPHPASGPVAVTFTVPAMNTRASDVTVEIYGQTGVRLNEIYHELLGAGVYRITWDGRNTAGTMAADGTYFIKISAGSQVTVAEIKLIK